MLFATTAALDRYERIWAEAPWVTRPSRGEFMAFCIFTKVPDEQKVAAFLAERTQALSAN
ncbi:MAG: hypothetical protein H0U59_12890 [Gemmatimonadaceae bacterium]|nr:hypothetical protein [Gemmatimonadaceae bacterium]